MSDLSDSPEESKSPSVGPAVARELVRLQLRSLREQTALDMGTVVRRMDWSLSKLARIEKGDVTIQPLEVRGLLSLYGVDDELEVNRLAQLCQTARTRQWYSRFRLAGDFGRFVAFEYEAAVIKSWQVLRIPALLQTRRYALDAAALSARRHPDDPGVRAEVDLVMDRQQALLSRLEEPHPPRITAMIDESVLRRIVGGHDTMRDQLDHLLTVAANDAYTIGVVPSDAVQHPGLGGAFTLLEFEDVSNALFVRAAAGVDALITDDMVTAKYRDIMEDLRRISVVGDAALRTIRAVRAWH